MATTAPSDVNAPRRLGAGEDLFGVWPARLSWWSDGQIEITPLRPLDRPELLVYWSPGEITGGQIPDDAHLIGRLTSSRPHRFALPETNAGRTADSIGRANEETSAARGQLVVYSLGHQEIVATARLGPVRVGGER